LRALAKFTVSRVKSTGRNDGCDAGEIVPIGQYTADLSAAL
jgi:hypothetical protein